MQQGNLNISAKHIPLLAVEEDDGYEMLVPQLLDADQQPSSLAQACRHSPLKGTVDYIRKMVPYSEVGWEAVWAGTRTSAAWLLTAQEGRAHIPDILVLL